jgi:hypothetical protein
MSTVLRFLKSLFAVIPPQREIDEAYLAQSVDMNDLERRMREIDCRGRSATQGVMLGLYVR